MEEKRKINYNRRKSPLNLDITKKLKILNWYNAQNNDKREFSVSQLADKLTNEWYGEINARITSAYITQTLHELENLGYIVSWRGRAKYFQSKNSLESKVQIKRINPIFTKDQTLTNKVFAGYDNIPIANLSINDKWMNTNPQYIPKAPKRQRKIINKSSSTSYTPKSLFGALKTVAAGILLGAATIGMLVKSSSTSVLKNNETRITNIQETKEEILSTIQEFNSADILRNKFSQYQSQSYNPNLPNLENTGFEETSFEPINTVKQELLSFGPSMEYSKINIKPDFLPGRENPDAISTKRTEENKKKLPVVIPQPNKITKLTIEERMEPSNRVTSGMGDDAGAKTIGKVDTAISPYQETDSFTLFGQRYRSAWNEKEKQHPDLDWFGKKYMKDN